MTIKQIRKAKDKLRLELEKLQAECPHKKPYVGMTGRSGDGEFFEIQFCSGCDKNWGKIISERSESW